MALQLTAVPWRALTPAGVQDCAVLAWSLARLAYRDDDLMAALRQRYLDTSVHSAQSVGTVSQMLKGCAVSGALTRELYALLLEQAEGALGSAEHARRMAQQVCDGCAPALLHDPAYCTVHCFLRCMCA